MRFDASGTMPTMPNTIDCRFGDIVLVPFPFSDQTTSKKRPAVVVSSDEYHRERPDVLLLAVTSRFRPESDLDVAIAGWEAAGLLKSSLLKPVLTTADRKLLIRQLGSLQAADRAALRALLGRILGS